MTQENLLPQTIDDLPIWLINLPRATKRRANMEKRLAEIGIAYDVFPGVDGKAEEERLLKTVDQRAFERNMGRIILIGGIGCYHSHLGVWDEFLKSDHPIALILEDDVVFHDDFVDAVNLALKATDSWDLLKLNRIRAKLPISQGEVGPYRLNAYLGPNTGTAAYLIKRETAEKLRRAMIPVTRATDHEINRFFKHKFRLRGLEPFPSHPDDQDESFITGTGFQELKKFPILQRLPNLWLRFSNYFRRLWWMIKTGEIIPKRTQLVAERDIG